MSFEFSTAKNGAETCSYNGKFLHSKYNPQNEGEKFVANLAADFSPSCIIIIEPALSYCVPFLRNRFKDASLYAIRCSRDFSKTDALWDKVFYFDSDKDKLSNDLFYSLGEETLFSAAFFEWTPSRGVFTEETAEIWQAIKSAVLKARDVLGTRSHFAKRWFKNSFIFAANITNTEQLSVGDSPVIIAASGRSLETSLPYLQTQRNKFFLIAVSSAYSALLRYGIIPDLVISTDGGYWAKRHIAFPASDKMLKEANARPLFAFSSEAAVPRKILETQRILPLCYDDGSSRIFFQSAGISFMNARRNGTVSGTAAEFALTITTGPVFFCGLDQAPAKGFQHTQPNALDMDAETTFNRIKPKESKFAMSQFSSAGSLEIYRNWFITRSEYFSARLFRLSDNFRFSFGLGKIRDINWQDFSSMIKSYQQKQTIGFIKKSSLQEKSARIKKLFEILEASFEKPAFLNDLFPTDFLMLKREKSEEKALQLKQVLEEKCRLLEKELKDLI